MKDARGPFIVEFFGLPGSGKSTLCNVLKHVLIARGLAVADLGEYLGDGSMSGLRRHAMRARYAAYGTLRAPIRVLKAAQLVRRDGQDSLRNALKVVWNIVVILGWYQWLRERDDRHDMVLVDQGLVQAVWSVRFSARDDQIDWPAFLANCGLDSMLLVALRSDPGLARERLVGRVAGPSRMNAYVGQDHEQQWIKADRILDELTSGLRIAAPEAMITEAKDDGTRSPEELARMLLPTILAARGQD